MDAFIQFIADGLIVAVLVLSVFAILKYSPADIDRRYKVFVRLILAGLMVYLVAKLVGYLWQPEDLRPFQILGVEPKALYLNNPGFPSDHMLFCVFLTFATWFATRRGKLVVALAIMTILVGVGRVAALVHSPLDVIGGLVIASLSLVWYLDFKTLNFKA